MSHPDQEELDKRLARVEEQNQRLTDVLEALARNQTSTAKPRRNWDAYAATIATFIGLVAVVVAAYTAYLERRQLRAQVWPRVEIWYSSQHFKFAATNQGMGPARISALRVTVNGVVMRTWSDIERAGEFGGARFWHSDIDQRVLPPDRETVILQPDDNDVSRAKFREFFPGRRHPLIIEACYCSVLDECWVATSEDRQPDGNATPGSCPIPAEERFRG